MNELEDILNYLETTSLEPHDDYTSEFSYKEQKKLWKYIKNLQQENQELKKMQCTFLGTGCQSKMKDLKNQLEYLRSGEYLNQLKFERDMLQYVTDNGEVSKEDKTYIDCTHRNTELLGQQKEFIEYLKNWLEILEGQFEGMHGVNAAYQKLIIDTVNEVLSKYKEIIGGDNK